MKIQLELLPGGAADEAMLNAAQKAPVGIAVFSPEYFAKKWPMRELEILVTRDVMLPVVFRFDGHEQFVQSLRSSAQQALVKGDWETFTKDCGANDVPQEGRGLYGHPAAGEAELNGGPPKLSMLMLSLHTS